MQQHMRGGGNMDPGSDENGGGDSTDTESHNEHEGAENYNNEAQT
jgi:hypothetical protein